MVKKVGDGGTLTSAEAGDFEAAILSADTARDARAQALLVKWATGGRLTQVEERELESHHPGILARGVPDLATPAPAMPAAAGHTAPPASFTLAAGDPAFAVFPITKEQLAEWSARYGSTSPRQIRRWIEEDATPDDPCPIGDPVRFAEWWPRRKKWRVPDWLLKAAHESRASAPPPAATSPAASAADVPASTGTPPATSINLADYQLGEGEVVQQQRRIVAALYFQLERAYLEGTGDIDLLQSKYNKAGEALRKHVKDDREDQKGRGLLIPRASVQRDLDTASELIRQMSETESRRVLELCPSLGPEQRSEVTAAVLRVADARTRVLRSLKSLKSADDALLELAAA